jgi:uncharacterized protein (DUF433 family)
VSADREAFERAHPFAGPCAFCGFRDRRHRVADAWAGMHRAGDSIESLARSYDVPESAVRGGLAFAEEWAGEIDARETVMPGELP